MLLVIELFASQRLRRFAHERSERPSRRPQRTCVFPLRHFRWLLLLLFTLGVITFDLK